MCERWWAGRGGGERTTFLGFGDIVVTNLGFNLG